MQLGLSNESLSIIQDDNQHSVERRCNAMLQKWLQVDTSASWEKILRAIDICTGQVEVDNRGD